MYKKTFQYLLLAISISMLSACSNEYGLSDTSYSTTKANADTFWKWFEANKAMLDLEDQDNETNKKLGKQLNTYKYGISYLLRNTDDGESELTLSCGGNKELVPFIEILYKQKPKIDDWIVHKYMQAKAIPEKIEYEELSLLATDFKLYLKDKQKQVLIIVSLNDSMMYDVRYKLLVQQFIVNSLGEENTIKHVSSVIFQAESQVDEKLKSMTIHQLKNQFEATL